MTDADEPSTAAASPLTNDLLSLSDIAHELESKIKVHDAKHRGKKYTDTFLGSEAVDALQAIVGWRLEDHRRRLQGRGLLLPAELAGSFTRERAEIVGQTLQERFKLIDRVGHTGKDSLLVDDGFIYVFAPKENRRRGKKPPLLRRVKSVETSTPQQKCKKIMAKKIKSLDAPQLDALQEEDFKGDDADREEEDGGKRGGGEGDKREEEEDGAGFFARLLRDEIPLKEIGWDSDDRGNILDDILDVDETALVGEGMSWAPDDEDDATDDPLRSHFDPLSAASILESMLEVKMNRIGKDEYPDTFIGSDAVDLLIKCEMAGSRIDAVELGRTLETEYNLFSHVEGRYKFEDSHYLYVFNPENERRFDTSKDPGKSWALSFSSTNDDEELRRIASEFRTGVPVKDRTHGFHTYRDTFVGNEAVSYLVKTRHAKNRIDAVALGQLLASRLNLFTSARRISVRGIGGGVGCDFRDDLEFYSFNDDDGGGRKPERGELEVTLGEADLLRRRNDDRDERRASEASITIEEVERAESTALNLSWEHSKSLFCVEEDSFAFSDKHSKVVRWLHSLRRLDPRYRILTHFRKVSQLGEEKPDLAKLDPAIRMWYLSRRQNVFTVWRETKNEAIRKMMCGQAVGKGLDIKGKSAKAGEIAGYVPFLQIGCNKHKYEIKTLSTKAKIRVFFVDSAKDEVIEKVQRCAEEMVEDVTKAKQVLERESGTGTPPSQEKMKNARTILLESDMADPSIVVLNQYPKKFGLEISVRLFWRTFFLRQDITRIPGSEYDTRRPSLPKSQDANFKTLCAKHKGENFPRPVVWQHDEKNPFNPQEFLIAYEEHGRVLPVASDFDAFLIGTRGFDFDETEHAFPDDQSRIVEWTVDQVGTVLDVPPRPGSWAKRWGENCARVRDTDAVAFKCPYPLGFGDGKTRQTVKEAVESLSSPDGCVRHGAEAFNLLNPQEMDQKFLVVSDCRGAEHKPWFYQSNRKDGQQQGAQRGLVPWRYMNEPQLREFLCHKIDHGFTFPLNPKWVLCDPGWKKVYDKLIASKQKEVIRSMNLWYPPTLRKKIDDIAARHPFGFTGGVLRSQEEVQEHFKPILKRENTPYRKSAIGCVRPAKKGEKIVSATSGRLESEIVVSKDTSYVAYNISGSTYYVLTKEEFDENYDQSTLKAIDPDETSMSSLQAKRLKDEGFKTCQSKNKRYAHELTDGDMEWISYGASRQKGKNTASYFVAPWGESMKVQSGDVLVMAYPEGDEIYGIEHFTFIDTYSPIGKRMLKHTGKYRTSRRSEIRHSSSLGFEGQKQKTQDEVKEKFLPLLREKGSVYSKPATTLTYARRGKKGENFVTVIEGKQETQNQVKDDSSWVIFGKSNEFYISKDDVFQSRYDVSSARPVDQEDSKVPKRIRMEGFQEYKSKPVPMLALEMNDFDLAWLSGKDSRDDPQLFAYFESPWGEPLRVENGDMLVTQYYEGNDEVYRVEKLSFHDSYKPYDIQRGWGGGAGGVGEEAGVASGG